MDIVGNNIPENVSRFLVDHPLVSQEIVSVIPSLKAHCIRLGLVPKISLGILSDSEDGTYRLDIILDGKDITAIRRALRKFTRVWWNDSRSQLRDDMDFRVKLV